MAKKIMVMWSGGIDSTSVLKQYLEQTDHDIVACHIDYKIGNNHDRHIMEMDAIMEMEERLQAIRPFEFICPTLWYPSPIFGKDLSILPTVAVPLAYAKKCTEIVIGYVSDARDQQIKYVRKSNRFLNTIALQFALMNDWSWTPHIDKPGNGIYNTKEVYISHIEELLELTWFCRRPHKVNVGERGCGECHTCKHVQRALRDRMDKQEEVFAKLREDSEYLIGEPFNGIKI